METVQTHVDKKWYDRQEENRTKTLEILKKMIPGEYIIESLSTTMIKRGCTAEYLVILTYSK